MLTEKYDFRITDQMTIPLRPHWIANDSYREKCKMLVLNRSKGEIHKVDFSKVTDYIKEGDVICFNDSTIINHMFICKTRQNRLIKIVLEGFLPNNRVIISGLLKERLNANDVFYLHEYYWPLPPNKLHAGGSVVPIVFTYAKVSVFENTNKARLIHDTFQNTGA